MIAKNASIINSRKSSKVIDESLTLPLDSLGSSLCLKERLEKTERLTSTCTTYPNGALTQREQSKRQKKLNSSVKVSHPSPDQRIKNFSYIIPTKPNNLSICRTVSIAYVNQQPKKSRLIYHIRKQNPQYQDLQIKEATLSQVFDDNMNDNFTTVKGITDNCRNTREQQNRNNALIKVNDELLKQIKAMEDLAFTNDHIFADLTKRLEQEHDKCEAMKRQILFLEEDRKRKQEKVAVEQRKNQSLVRQINDMKLKLKENLKELQALRAEQHENSTSSTKRCWSPQWAS